MFSEAKNEKKHQNQCIRSKKQMKFKKKKKDAMKC